MIRAVTSLLRTPSYREGFKPPCNAFIGEVMPLRLVVALSYMPWGRSATPDCHSHDINSVVCSDVVVQFVNWMQCLSVSLYDNSNNDSATGVGLVVHSQTAILLCLCLHRRQRPSQSKTAVWLCATIICQLHNLHYTSCTANVNRSLPWEHCNDSGSHSDSDGRQ